MEFVDYYNVLNVSSDSSLEEIKKAFRILAKKYHPDKNKSNNASLRFREIFEAYEVLKNPETKEIFNNNRNKFYRNNNFTQVKTSYNYNHVKNESRKKAEYFSKMTFDKFLKTSIFIFKKTTSLFSIILTFVFGIFMILFGLYAMVKGDSDKGIIFGIMLWSTLIGGLLIYFGSKEFKKINR